ncbi:FadR/GntR family transcriptional regulator [Mariniluteicoccus endophyticus]
MTTNRRESTARLTEVRLRELMLDKGLRPGDPLPTESELCDRLGVSRSSLREAMRTLTALDIVDVRHGHGTFVGQMSLEPFVQALVFRGSLSHRGGRDVLREVVEFRETLDTGLAGSVCAAMAGSEHPRLDELVDEMVALSTRGKDFTDADRLFHQLLLEEVPNQLVGQMVTALWDIHTRILPHMGVPTPDDILATAHAHGAMVRAAQAGDVAAYRSAVADHYLPLRRVLDRQDEEDQGESEGSGEQPAR